VARRKKTVAVKPVTRKSTSLRKQSKKPPGIRVEDLKPWSIFKYVDEDEEIHIAIPDSRYRIEDGRGVWGSSVPTLRIMSDGSLMHDSLLCGMHSWDYTIKLLDETHAIRLQILNKIPEHKLFKPRLKSDDTVTNKV
jgi:hypothetical protein